MNIIKLSAIGSTNDFLKELRKTEKGLTETLVVADHQVSGRGQMGAKWQSEEGKSLTFSLFVPLGSLPVQQQQAINFAVALALKKGLEQLGIVNVNVKWPNDILAGSRKVCGVLIENQLLNDEVASTIIGVGVNLNNDAFEDLPQAGSLKMVTGTTHDPAKVMKVLSEQLLKDVKAVTSTPFEVLKMAYEAQLFKKDTVCTFQSKKDTFLGIIRGVTDEGLLRVELEAQQERQFQLKEVRLVY